METLVDRLFLICATAVTLLAILIFNILALRAFYLLDKHKSANNLFYINLAICDFLVGLTTGPATLTSQIVNYWVFGTGMCNVLAATDNTLIIVGTWTLAVSSMDRCVALSRPMWHRSFMTIPMVLKGILCVWVLGIMVALLPFMGWGGYQFSKHSFNCGLAPGARYYFLLVILMALLIPMTIVIICYAIILRVILPSLHSRQRMMSKSKSLNDKDSSDESNTKEGVHTVIVHMENIRRHPPSEYGSAQMLFRSSSYPKRILKQQSFSSLAAKVNQKKQINKFSNKTVKPAIRTLVIVGLFALCTGPTFIISFIFWLNPHGTKISPTTSRIFHWMVFVNSALNPITYCLMDRDIRNIYRVPWRQHGVACNGRSGTFTSTRFVPSQGFTSHLPVRSSSTINNLNKS